MRIIVMSDTHRNYTSLEKIIRLHPNADMYIHLGDGEEDVNLAVTRFPEIAEKFNHICGNCDFNSLSPNLEIIEAHGHRILAAHGHLLSVGYGLAHMKNVAAENNCDIMLYGHTHVRYNSYEDGIYIMNPGSASCPRDGNKPSYGLIDIIDSGVVMNIADI